MPYGVEIRKLMRAFFRYLNILSTFIDSIYFESVICHNDLGKRKMILANIDQSRGIKVKKEEYKEEIEREIVKKREQMIECARTYGLVAEKTLQRSRELDELMNVYQRLFLHPDINKKAIYAFPFLFFLQYCREYMCDFPFPLRMDV